MESALDVLRRTGIWWSDPWWENEAHTSHLPLTEIRARIALLTTVFDRDWIAQALEAGPPNAVLARLVGSRGLWPFEDLMLLGKTIRAVSRAPGFAQKSRDLIGPKTHATLFECQMAEVFAQDDWGIVFSREEKHPTPDIVAETIEHKVGIECKRLERESWEHWASDLGLRVLNDPRTTHPHNDRAVNIEFDQRLTELLTKDADINQALLSEVVTRVTTLLADIGPSEPLPATRAIGDIVSVSVDRNTQGHHGQAGGISISAHAKTRRILHKVIEAGSQLRSFKTGIVAIFSDYVPSTFLLNLAITATLRAHPEQFANIAHVVVVTHATIFEVIPPALWSHPTPRDPSAARAAAHSLAKALPFPGTVETRF